MIIQIEKKRKESRRITEALQKSSGGRNTVIREKVNK
jgi:hypothetical protein